MSNFTENSGEPDSHPTPTITASTSAPATTRVIFFLLFLAILFLATWFRTANVTESLNFDETLERDAAVEAPLTIIKKYNYFFSKLSAHYTLKISDTEWGLRLPNIIAGIAAVWFMYVLGRTIMDRKTALLSAAALAINLAHIDFSQNGRYYSLMSLFWLLHLISIIRLARGARWYLLLYFVSLDLGIQSHPFFVPYAGIALGIFALYMIWPRPDTTLRSRIRSIVPIAAAFTIVMIFTVIKFKAMAGLVGSGESAQRVNNIQLTIPQYWSLLRRMLFPFDTPIRYIWITLAAAGIIVTIIRWRLLGMILLASVFLLPIPLLFVKVGHSYEIRYFAPCAVILALCIGAALGAILQLIQKLTSSDLSAPRARSLTRVAAATLAALFIASSAIILHSSWQYLRPTNPNWYQVTMTRGHWRDFATYMDRHLQNADPILHSLTGPGITSGTGYFHSLSILEFYLRWLRHPASPTPISNPVKNLTMNDNILQIAADNPHSNIWLIDWYKSALRLPPAYAETFPAVIRSKEQQLRVLGRPTVNMIEDGGTESDDYAKKLRGMQFVTETTGGLAFHGKRSMHLAAPETSETAAIFYRINNPVITIRNAGFDVWKDSQPIGWTLLEGTTESLRRAAAPSSHALAITPAQSTTTLTQSIPDSRLPGSTITGSVVISAPGPAPQVQLQWDSPAGPGHIPFTTTANKPSPWITRSGTGTIPPDAYPASIELQITQVQITAPATTVPATIDSVSITVNRTTTYFDPAKTYFLTMQLKADSIPNPLSRNDDRLGKIRIYGRTATGGYFSRELAQFKGTFDWTPIALQVNPANFPELHALLYAGISIDLKHTPGRAWVDNVQLEAAPATPFTPHIRLPHDETLARLQAQSPLEKSNRPNNNQSK